jgi:hypothetical protein
MKTTVIHGNPKFRLFVKRLSSGKYQVKFKVVEGSRKGVYGYVLVPSGTTLKEVVSTIKVKILSFSTTDSYYHQHLYSLGKYEQMTYPLMVSKS